MSSLEIAQLCKCWKVPLRGHVQKENTGSIFANNSFMDQLGHILGVEVHEHVQRTWVLIQDSAEDGH